MRHGTAADLIGLLGWLVELWPGELAARLVFQAVLVALVTARAERLAALGLHAGLQLLGLAYWCWPAAACFRI